MTLKNLQDTAREEEFITQKQDEFFKGIYTRLNGVDRIALDRFFLDVFSEYKKYISGIIYSQALTDLHARILSKMPKEGPGLSDATGIDPFDGSSYPYITCTKCGGYDECDCDGFNDCLSQSLTAIDEAYEELRKGV